MKTKGIHPWAKFESYCSSGDIESIEKMLDEGCDIDMGNSFGSLLLLRAAESGRAEIVDMLVKLGAYVDAVEPSAGLTALMLAAERGFASCVSSLLKAGASVLTKDAKGETALMKACRWGRGQAARLLVLGGSMVHDKDKTGASTMVWAVRGGDVDCVEAVMSGWTSAEIRGSMSRTALNVARAARRSACEQRIKDVIARAELELWVPRAHATEAKSLRI